MSDAKKNMGSRRKQSPRLVVALKVHFSEELVAVSTTQPYDRRLHLPPTSLLRWRQFPS